MADDTELLPEERDEQHQRLISDLRRRYRVDSQKAQHLARLQQRLFTGATSSPRLLPRHGVPLLQQGPGDVRPSRAAMRAGRNWQRRLSILVAVLIAALLVSSLLLVLNRTHSSSIGTPTKPGGGLTTLRSLHMIDASTGWALSEQSVMRTTDGGIHWKDVTPPGAALTRSTIADFLNAGVASVATPGPNATSMQVLHTSDGGQTWQHATPPMPFPRSVSFIDAQHGWLLAAVRLPQGAAEPVSVFRTTDGGQTWVRVASALFSDATPPGRLPYGGQKLGIGFLNVLTGWVTGTVSLSNLAWLYVTHDGGLTWSQQALPMPPGAPSALLSVLPPTFFSATDGILPVNFADPTTERALATALYVTHDGGQTWQSTVPPPTPLPIPGIADMQHWWGTDGTVLYHTDDGGSHWTRLSPGAPFKHIAYLDFVSDTVGWALSSTASASSLLLKTVDGGRTWTTLSTT